MEDESYTLNEMFIKLQLLQESNRILKEDTGFIRTSIGTWKADRGDIEPRCESDLERHFWHVVLNDGTGQFEDYDCQVKAGRYRLDSAFKISGKWIGIELDGSEFHDKTRDSRRDTWILENTEIAEIIRIPYAAMTYYPHATMGAIGDWHREFRTAEVRVENYTLPWRCILEDIEKTRCREHDDTYPYRSLDEYFDYAEATYETWKTRENEALAGSPKGIYLCWNIRPITRMVKNEKRM